MRILYVAKHDQKNSNDDEGAISFALESLGHTVIKLPEAPRPSKFHAWPSADVCLFHKWGDTESIREIKSVMPCVFWYFDLVDWPQDLTLASRCEARKRWMTETIPLVDIGFCTDGDWVERDRSGKLQVLRQGADERVVGFGTKQGSVYDTDVLFVGGVKGCGVQRESFVTDLRKKYGGRFMHVEKGVYGRSLANLVASAKVVVCPDSPVTDRYWSNRVYVMAGFGACLLHPVCSRLRKISNDCVSGVSLYQTRGQLFDQIDELLAHPDVAQMMRNEALMGSQVDHLYRHRCEDLLRVVKERFHV